MCGSWGSIIYTRLGYGLVWMIQGSIPGMAGDCHLQNVWIGCGFQQALCLMGTVCSIAAGKEAGASGR